MIFSLAYPLARDFSGDIDRMFKDFLAPTSATVGGRIFSPAVNLKETETSYNVETELPGVKPEDVEVEVHERQLSIRGKRMHEKTEEGENYTRREMWSGEFTRVVQLPSEVEEDKIDAHLRDGILKVTVPKAKSSMPRKVQIKAQ